jgi:hypothetical protein
MAIFFSGPLKFTKSNNLLKICGEILKVQNTSLNFNVFCMIAKIIDPRLLHEMPIFAIITKIVFGDW